MNKFNKHKSVLCLEGCTLTPDEINRLQEFLTPHMTITEFVEHQIRSILNPDYIMVKRTPE